MSVARFVLQGDAKGILGELTAAHPSLVVEATPMGGHLMVRCIGDREALSTADAAVTSVHSVRYDAEGEATLIMIIEMPATEAKVIRDVHHAGLVLMPPVVHRGGIMELRAVLFTGTLDGVARISGLRLASKSMMSEKEIEDELRSTGLLLPFLTRRQAQAVLTALEGGYYDSPRRTTAGEAAAAMGVARSTFEEHLRSAESQLVHALAPVVRLRLSEMDQGREAASGEALGLFARFSDDLGLYVTMAVRGGAVTAVSLDRQAPSAPAGRDHPYLARVIEHLATGRDDLRDIPVDLPNSRFEREVLGALRDIPPGEVVTYGEIARRLGRPRAARAVGSACAHNPVPVVIPCHRVVPATGGLGNYSGGDGPGTKASLLEKEGALPRLGKARERSGVRGSRPQGKRKGVRSAVN